MQSRPRPIAATSFTGRFDVRWPGGTVDAWRLGVDRLWLQLLVAADLVFIAVHIVHRLALPQWPLLDISNDRGYGEMYHYLKQFWIVLLLAAAAVRLRDVLLGCWATAFAYLLLDDALRLHERAGEWLAEQGHVSARYGAAAQDFGELAFLATVAVTGAVAFTAVLSTAKAHVSQAARVLLLLFAALAVFGVGVDLLHSIAWRAGIPGFGVLEDGGEMIVMSAILAYAAALGRPVRAG